MRVSEGAHDATAGGLGLGTALAIAALLFLVTATPFVWAAFGLYRDRRALRNCPLCGSDGVRSAQSERLDVLHARVRLECGQCGTVRRSVRTHAELRRHARRLRRDQRRIAGRLHRPEAPAPDPHRSGSRPAP